MADQLRFAREELASLEQLDKTLVDEAATFEKQAEAAKASVARPFGREISGPVAPHDPLSPFTLRYDVLLQPPAIPRPSGTLSNPR